jgi:mannosyl-oligosaccharide alpha-1,2-mannosidase
MSDSLYEYLPKEYALLGGLSPLYRTLYEGSMATAIKHNIFRPMVPDNADILLSGNARAENPDRKTLDPQGQHLACFAGGMLGLGSKLLNRPDHLDIARKLVDGCIWAYNALPLGIMPETFHMVPCISTTSCVWDESKWHSGILEKLSDEDTRSVSQVIADKRLPRGSPTSEIRDIFFDQRQSRVSSSSMASLVTRGCKMQLGRCSKQSTNTQGQSWRMLPWTISRSQMVIPPNLIAWRASGRLRH